MNDELTTRATRFHSAFNVPPSSFQMKATRALPSSVQKSIQLSNNKKSGPLASTGKPARSFNSLKLFSRFWEREAAPAF
jgi:hypothetical protein